LFFNLKRKDIKTKRKEENEKRKVVRGILERE